MAGARPSLPHFSIRTHEMVGNEYGVPETATNTVSLPRVQKHATHNPNMRVRKNNSRQPLPQALSGLPRRPSRPTYRAKEYAGLQKLNFQCSQSRSTKASASLRHISKGG